MTTGSTRFPTAASSRRRGCFTRRGAAGQTRRSRCWHGLRRARRPAITSWASTTCDSCSGARALCAACHRTRCCGDVRGPTAPRQRCRRRGRSGVSWGLHLAPDAVADLRRLEPLLQEHVLDELDDLAADPGRIPPPLPGWGIVHTFARVESSRLHVLTLILARDDHQQLVTLLGIHASTL